MANDSAEIRFAGFRLVPGQRQLTRGSAPVALGARAMDILLCLTASAGQVVTKQALMKAVWPGRIVEENNLTVNMTALRKALGSGSEGDGLIKTVTGRGYMFVASSAVESETGASAAAAALPHLPAPLTRLIGRDAASTSCAIFCASGA